MIVFFFFFLISHSDKTTAWYCVAYMHVHSLDKTYWNKWSIEVRWYVVGNGWLLIYDATSAFVLLLLKCCDWETVCIVIEYFMANIPRICYFVIFVNMIISSRHRGPYSLTKSTNAMWININFLFGAMIWMN